MPSMAASRDLDRFRPSLPQRELRRKWGGATGGRKAIGSMAVSKVRKSGRELTPSVKLTGYHLLDSRSKGQDEESDGDSDEQPNIIINSTTPATNSEQTTRKSMRERNPTRTYDEILIAEVAQKQNSASIKQRSSQPSNKIRRLLSSLDDVDVPIDKAAENTFESSEEEMEILDQEEDHHEEWLWKVANQLGAGEGRKRVRSASRNSADNEGNVLDSMSKRSARESVCSAVSFSSDSNTKVPASVLVSHAPAVLTPVVSERRVQTLRDVDKGLRHEYFVFDKDDADRMVGEVIVEGKKGWVEVCFGGAALVKCRSSHLIVLPRDNFKVGEQVPPDYIAMPLDDKSVDQSAKLKSSQCDKPSPAEKKQSRNRKQTVRIDDIFYWQCKCDEFNTATDQICHGCNAKRTPEAKRSKLLEIAEDAVNVDHVNSLEEAINQIPETSRPSIPDLIVAKLLEAKIAGINFSEFCVADNLDSRLLTSYFHWFCGTCTFENNFKKGLCSACRESKGYFARSSPLLEVAERIAMASKTAQDAYSSWPAHETRQIPEVVLESLITCTYMVVRNGTQRRCRNQKLDGLEFCKDHYDPSLLAALRVKVKEEDGTEASDSCGKESPTPSASDPRRLFGIASMKESLQSFLRSKIGYIRNTLGWTNNSIEDQLICGSDSKPFPLGLKVRTYFLGYDCHDGRIIKVRRQFLNDGSQDSRPVLMYRVVYNDGDQQDWLHHNICSLRQVFDLRNVDAEAPFDEQIPPGTLFEMKTGIKVKVIRHTRVQTEQFVTFVVLDDNSGGSAEIDLSLLKFQVGVVRKIAVGSKSDKARATAGASLIEWPISNDRVNLPENAGTVTQYKVCNGLHLLTKPAKVEHAIPHLNKLPNVDNPSHGRRGVKRPRWDPANVQSFILWDPSQCLICEICGQDKDDNQVVICDKCHSGFHSYCLRPVMVNIPKRDWVCAACSGRSNSLSFIEYSKNIADQPQSVLEFLKLPYATYNDFIKTNSEALTLFAGQISFNANKHKMVSKNLFTAGSILFVRSPDKNDWRLPSPCLTEKDYASSIESFVAAMKYCGMTNYSETCLHPQAGKTTEDMNNPALDQDNVQPLSKRNLEIFNAFKENLKRGIFPPVKVVHDEKYGFSVEAVKAIPTQTLIAEYTGEIITLEQSSESDSLMILLDSGDPATSLIIDPTNSGNIARFLSGINNMSLVSKRKANVRTRRFCLDGRMRVALFTSRRIEPGEKLNYDYNAGRVGQSSEQWLKGGFYDTSNFF